jgi:hypothetical protein
LVVLSSRFVVLDDDCAAPFNRDDQILIVGTEDGIINVEAEGYQSLLGKLIGDSIVSR